MYWSVVFITFIFGRPFHSMSNEIVYLQVSLTFDVLCKSVRIASSSISSYRGLTGETKVADVLS